MKVQCTQTELQDGNLGGCTNCGNLQEGVEPDAERYECEDCGERCVSGLEQLLLIGELEVVDD